MLINLRRRLRFGGQGQKGAVTVELAILLPVFLLLTVGLFDLVHAWYMKELVANASREAARYGTRYQADAGLVRLAPNALNPSISAWTKNASYNNYDGMLPADANLTVSVVSGGGSTASGSDLTIRVDATKSWWILGTLIPGLGSQTVTATTIMKME